MNSQVNHANPVPFDDMNWWNTTWPYRKLITMDHAKVASDLTDFTVLINISSDADLAERAQDDGDDITFVLYSDNTIQLNHEEEQTTSSPPPATKESPQTFPHPFSSSDYSSSPDKTPPPSSFLSFFIFSDSKKK